MGAFRGTPLKAPFEIQTRVLPYSSPHVNMNLGSADKSRTFTLQAAQSESCEPLKAHHRCARLNSKSAMRNMQNRFGRSELELRRPKNGLKNGPRSSQVVNSVQPSAQIPNLPTTTGLEG
eukprot:5621067-Alexandrium_andersonii.AAC.1